MRNATRWGKLAYATIITLYPPAFRAEFGEEMRAVFAAAMAEAARDSLPGVAALCLRELRDLPMSLLRAYLCGPRKEHQRQRLPSAARSASFARWGALGFGIGFALVGLLQSMLSGAAMGHSTLAPALIGTVSYPLAGALSGALLGMAGGSRRRALAFALVGSLAFSLGAWVTNYAAMLPALAGSPWESMLSLVQLTLIGAISGMLVGVGQRSWGQAARLGLKGALVFGLGRIAGFVLALVPWGIAQAVASYQAPPANAWLMAMPFFLMIFTGIVAGAIGGAYLGLAVGRRQLNRGHNVCEQSRFSTGQCTCCCHRSSGSTVHLSPHRRHLGPCDPAYGAVGLGCRSRSHQVG